MFILWKFQKVYYCFETFVLKALFSFLGENSCSNVIKACLRIRNQRIDAKSFISEICSVAEGREVKLDLLERFQFYDEAKVGIFEVKSLENLFIFH